jgi:hypothetical protein
MSEPLFWIAEKASCWQVPWVEYNQTAHRLWLEGAGARSTRAEAGGRWSTTSLILTREVHSVCSAWTRLLGTTYGDDLSTMHSRKAGVPTGPHHDDITHERVLHSDAPDYQAAERTEVLSAVNGAPNYHAVDRTKVLFTVNHSPIVHL